jgi:hypothetical protein
MDYRRAYRRAIGEMYTIAKFFVEETYDSLVWWEDTPKPSDEDILAYYESSKTEWAFIQMIFKRNMLLVECDYCALPDFPDRDKWIVYRQLLRDLPANWTTDTPFPQLPT